MSGLQKKSSNAISTAQENEKIIFWAPFLHIYQPPTQEPEILKRINRECYEPLLDVILESEKVKVTLNVNAVLLDLLIDHGLFLTLDKLRDACVQGKIELVGSAKYHPLLPLIPPSEINRQIELNEQTFRQLIPDAGIRRGFFPPEMAVSEEIFPAVKAAGFEWAIMSGIACPEGWNFDRFDEEPNGIVCVYRDDVISNEISFNHTTAEKFIEKIKKLYKTDAYIVTAQDGETFGHHHRNYERTFLAKAFKLANNDPGVELCFISDLLEKFPRRHNVTPRPSSWSTNPEDLTHHVPFPLWKHPDNPVHRIQYRFLRAVNKLIEVLEKTKIPPGKNGELLEYKRTARWFYDQGVYSCQFWWASMRPMWSPNLVIRGAELLQRAALNANLALIKLGNIDGEEYFDQITQYYGQILRELVTQTAARDRVRLIK